MPDIPEWEESVRLINEKEMLGFYVTGHPLDRYRKELKSYSTVNSATIANRRDQEEVTIGGLVSKLKLTQTKKNNERMAIITVEDPEGTLDMLVFPRAYKEIGTLLVKDAILFFKGNVDKKEGTPKLLVNEVTTIHEAHKKFTRSVHVRLAVNGGSEGEKLKNLQEILTQYHGSTPVYLEFIDENNARSQMLVDRSLFVAPSENLVQSLQKAFGEEAIRLGI